MTNSVISDRNLTIPGAGVRSSDTPKPGARTATDAPGASVTTDTADVDRAQLALNQVSSVNSETSVVTADQVRDRLEQLKSLVGEDPRAAAAAHARIDSNVFDAAMARPAA